MTFIGISKLYFLFASVIADIQNSESVVNRVTKIAEQYSNWALGEPDGTIQRVQNTYQVTQVQPPPRYYNTGKHIKLINGNKTTSAPVKQFFHSVRIQPPPKSPVFHNPSLPAIVSHPFSTPTTTQSPVFLTHHSNLPIPKFPRNVTVPPFFYQQIPPPVRLAQLPTEQNQRFHYPKRTQESREYMPRNPNFPKLLESRVPLPPSPIFPSNSSNLPSHMSSNFGSSVLSQLLSPIFPEPLTSPSSIVTSSSPGHPKTQVAIPLDSSPELTKEEVMKTASKKRLFGFPRFPIEQRAFETSCLRGWCGDECCDVRRQFSPVSTTIQATAMPGSPGPPHPLVLVVHPAAPVHPQCTPACQPQCSPQCVARLQYMQHAHFYNSIVEPTCRPDCMPSCHVDCLIIPPQRVRCNSFHCQCLAGYVQCAAFTCCMRYPVRKVKHHMSDEPNIQSMAARMRSNALEKSSEELRTIEEASEKSVIDDTSHKRLYTPIKMVTPTEVFGTHGWKAEDLFSYLKFSDIEDITPIPRPKMTYWTKKRVVQLDSSTAKPTTSTSVIPCATSTTTSTMPSPATTTTPTSTTSTTTSALPTTVAPTTTTMTTTTTVFPTTTMLPTTTTATIDKMLPTAAKPSLPTTSASGGIVMNLTPIYPDMTKNHKIPMIPAYGLWAIPHTGSRDNMDLSVNNENRNSVGDIRGRHFIRSENFLDVLSELAQVYSIPTIGCYRSGPTTEESSAGESLYLEIDKRYSDSPAELSSVRSHFGKAESGYNRRLLTSGYIHRIYDRQRPQALAWH